MSDEMPDDEVFDIADVVRGAAMALVAICDDSDRFDRALENEEILQKIMKGIEDLELATMKSEGIA